MRKTALIETINKQKQQIDEQKKQIDEQKKQIENVMDIFKILAEGGDISVHIYPNKEPSYFVSAKGSAKSDFDLCSRKIFEGIYSRGLLIVTRENVHEDFAVQRYELRLPKIEAEEH